MRPSPRHFSKSLLVLAVLSALLLGLLSLPVVALLWRTLLLAGSAGGIDLRSVAVALVISLSTTAVSVVIIATLGTPLALVMARYRFPLKSAASVLIELPVVMPPIVAGLALLAAFGRRGLVGAHLAQFGVTITFTPLAVILAQVFVAAPFYVRAAQFRFASLPRELEDAAGIDGADLWRMLWYVTLPLSARAMLGGLVLSWARALGEFGATIIFAGSLQGRTQTMPLLVYSALERDLSATFVTAFILLALAALALFATRWLARLDDEGADPLAGR